MLELLFTGTKIVSTYNRPDLFRLRFIKSWNAAVLTGYSAPTRVFHDGTLVASGGSTATNSVSRIGGKVMSVKGNSPNYYYYEFEEIAANFKNQPLYGPIPTAPSVHDGYIDDRRGWLLRVPWIVDTNKLLCFDLETGAQLWTLVLGENIGGLQTAIHYVDDNHIAAIRPQNGRVMLIDYIRQVIEFKTYVQAHSLSTWDCTNGLVMTYHNTDGFTRIYHPTAVPYSLNQPTLNPSSIYLFGGSTVTTRLLGEHNEPCEGWWVRWFLQYGKGALQKLVSKTDADGYARNYYFAPRDPTQIGSETIRVEVAA